MIPSPEQQEAARLLQQTADDEHDADHTFIRRVRLLCGFTLQAVLQGVTMFIRNATVLVIGICLITLTGMMFGVDVVALVKQLTGG